MSIESIKPDTKEVADSLYAECETIDDLAIDLIMKLPFNIRTSLVDLLDKQAKMMKLSEITDEYHGTTRYQDARLVEARASLSYRKEYEKLLKSLIEFVK